MANAPQETIGKYRVIAALGSGSQGAVYRARDETLGREVALKVLHPHLATPDLIERFQREARIIASIPHPNIAGVSEIGEHDGKHYIAVEYVPHSLAELIALGPMDVTLAVSVAYQTALALEAARASENAITHHDVKPDNILLTSLDSGAVVKLIDFGIAHAEGMTSITQAGSQWGTPLYMPPEQWAGERGDTRSDIYSLGVVLYHTLAGRPPFDSDAANNMAKQTEIAQQHQQTAAPSLRSVRGDVSEALDAIIAKCMAKTPSARYQTPGELANALAGMLGQVAPEAPSPPQPAPSPAKPSAKPRSRMPLIVAAGFGAIILVVLAALAVFQSGNSEPDLPPRMAAGGLPPASTPTPYPIQPTYTPLPTSTPLPAVAPTSIPTPAPTLAPVPEPTSTLTTAPVFASTPALTSTPTPAPTYTPTPIPWTSISSGWHHTCALQENGAAVCWGSNFYGGQFEFDPPAGSFVAISAGGWHTCVLRGSGAAECWGNNDNSQSSPPDGFFVAISAGWRHTCALRESGAAECWGNNFFGRPNSPDGSFATISAGWWHTCALRESGAAECWGKNDDNGQSTPPDGSFTTISAGWGNTCALREGGAAECWGRNDNGQSTPPDGSFVAISAGSSHTCALRENGAAECWGRNDNGQSTPPDGSFTAISAGWGHTCALREDGVVECWGRNDHGQSDPPDGTFRR